jgi:HSP20 family protein
VARFDLPGIDPGKDVQVTVDDGILCVSGERHQTAVDGENRYFSERGHGSFERAIPLPAGVTGDGITAGYRDGVLEVVVPKAARLTGPRRIPVSGAAEHALAAGAADAA